MDETRRSVRPTPSGLLRHQEALVDIPASVYHAGRLFSGMEGAMLNSPPSADDLERLKETRQFDRKLAELLIKEHRVLDQSKIDLLIQNIRGRLDPHLASAVSFGISPEDDAAAALAKRGPKRKRPPAPSDNMIALTRDLARAYVKEYCQDEPKPKRKARKLAVPFAAKLRTFLVLYLD
jgi:hypothetical protein